MNRSAVLDRLTAQKAKIRENFGVKYLGLFGSAARDDMRPDSDVDLLVEFSQSPTFDTYVELQSYLERILNTKVDLVTVGGLKPRARSLVERDLIRVA